MSNTTHTTRWPRLLVLALPLLSGCVGRRTYQGMMRDYESSQDTAYFRQETAPRAPARATQRGHDPAFLDEVEAKILATKRRWEATLAEPTGNTEGVVPQLAEQERERYRKLARDPALRERLAEAVDLDTLLGLLPERNPAVHAARAALRATLEQYPQAAYLDNILKQYNAFTKQLNTKIGPPRHKEMQAMSFPFPDALALKGRIVSEEVEIAQRKEQIALRDAILRLRTAYYSYLFLGDAIRINRGSQELLTQMIKVAQTKIRTDKAKYSAVLTAQVELSKLNDDIITLEQQRETVVAEINTLLNRPPDALLGPPVAVTDMDLGLSLEELYEAAIQNRQELHQQRLRIGKMTTMAELATRMAYPDASTGASYFEDRMRSSSGTGGTKPAFATRRELNHRQTPWFGQRDAYIREIKTRTGALEKTLTAIEDDTRFRVKKAHFGVETAKRSVSLYRNALLPQARQALEAAQAGYRAGRTDFLTFLDAQRTLLEVQLSEQRALQDHRTGLARLDQIVGQPLKRVPFGTAGREPLEPENGGR